MVHTISTLEKNEALPEPGGVLWWRFGEGDGLEDHSYRADGDVRYRNPLRRARLEARGGLQIGSSAPNYRVNCKGHREFTLNRLRTPRHQNIERAAG